MAKGSARRTYSRDARGRFASSGSAKPKAKAKPAPTTAGNRLTRDNAGRITSIGGDGATSRGGRLRTASGNHRATQVAKIRGGIPSGVVSRGGKPRGPKRPPVVTPEVMGPGAPGPGRMPRAADRPGSMTHTLRNTLRELARADAQRLREIESITGLPIGKPPSGSQGGTAAGQRIRDTARGGSVAQTLGTALRELAQSDARTMREMDQLIKDATPKLPGGSKGGGRRRVGGSNGGQRRLPGGRKRKPKS